MNKDDEDPPTQDLISRHIFLFPFKWENGVDPKKDGFSDKTDLGKFEEILIKPENSLIHEHGYRWERKAFELNHLNQYNEFNYYYDFVREVLYDLEGSEEHSEKGPLSSKQPGKSLLRHYELLKTNHSKKLDLTYKITTSDNLYELEIDSISLNVYETGIGVLAFFLGNKKYEKHQDILNINQFGRRIAPPFYALDPKLVGEVFDFGGEPEVLNDQLAITQSSELAKAITISIENGSKGLSEHFSPYRNKENIKHGPFLLPNFISCFFAKKSIITQEPLWDTSSKKIYLKPVLDDRMFVLCWYGNDELTNNMKVDVLNPLPQNTYPYLTNEFWFNYIFIDANETSSINPEYVKKLIKKHTYERWIGIKYATYYGVSRYSLVCLTSTLQTLGNSSFLAQHMESIYYKLFELAIVQRASVLRFADEVTHLSHFNDEEEQPGKQYETLSRKVENLYKNYIRFTNKIYFGEVTAQEQGIEMYDMLQEHMRIKPQVAELDKDIEELHTYVRLLATDLEAEGQKKTASKLNVLTFLGALFLVPSFIISMYGLKWYEPYIACSSSWLLLGFIGLGLLPLGFSIYKWIGGDFFTEKSGEDQNTEGSISNFWGGITALLIVLLLAAPFILPKRIIKKCPDTPQTKIEQPVSAVTQPPNEEQKTSATLPSPTDSVKPGYDSTKTDTPHTDKTK